MGVRHGVIPLCIVETDHKQGHGANKMLLEGHFRHVSGGMLSLGGE